MTKPSASAPEGPAEVADLGAEHVISLQDAWEGAPLPDDADDPLIGMTLSGTYVVERVLGEGGMGRIYEASHTRIRRKRVAIKVLRPELAQNPEVHGRFRREAEAAASITHPNVVSLFDVDRTPQGWPYLVSELLVGTDLAAHIERVGRLGPVTAIHIATQVCEALGAAHALGVAHRDLKPHNVFLVGDFAASGPPLRPQVKVLDFGLSRFLDEGNDSSLTRTGVVMGTPSYMAPEQARGLRADHLADVYGVGALVYAMLTGRAPFSEETPHLTILAVMERDPPRPRSLESSISEPLELVIQRAMAKEPADRYPDMASLRFALEPFGMPMFANSRRQNQDTVALSPSGGSRVALEAEADTVRLARPRLVLYLVLAVLVAALVLATMGAGVAGLMGARPLSPLETGLLLLAAVGTSLTPGVLLVRRVRREVWNNSARVLTLLARVQDPFTSGLVGLGCGVLSLLFIDGVLAHYAGGGFLVAGAGLGWAGWRLLLPAVAVLAAAAEVVRARWRDDESRSRRLLLGPGLSTLVIVLSGGVLYAGLEWWSAVAPAVSAAPPAPVTSAGAASPPASVVRAPGPAAPSARPSVVSRATDEELAVAVDLGVDGLLPLSERHPEDPAVLRALTLAFASRATGRADAMAVARRLLIAAPSAVEDKDLKVLIARGAETPGEASTLAFELMTEHMGSAGPDLLYEIYLTRPAGAERAREFLEQPAIQAKATPALKIAFELRRAPSCEARLPLLERATRLGDERAVHVLQPLVMGTKRGCGRGKSHPCPGACAALATEYRAAIAAILERLGTPR